MYQGADPLGFSGGEREAICLASSQTGPFPQSRFDTNSQARLGTFKNKMAAICEESS